METVLVVEDNETARDVMSLILRERGYHVLSATQADEALLVCQEHTGPIDLMVTDAALRTGNGKRLAQRIAEVRPAMKVLYVSGYSSVELIRKGHLDWNAPFLHKPFTAEALANAVRRLLDNPAAAQSPGA